MVHGQIDIFWCQRAKQQNIGWRMVIVTQNFSIGLQTIEESSMPSRTLWWEVKLHVDDSSVKSAIVHFYEELYHENFPSRPFLEGISYSTINLEDA